jgi:hypothetical protein
MKLIELLMIITIDTLPDFTPKQLKQRIDTKMKNKKIPETLFHYTDGGAVLKIIENKELWATSVQYMNDPGELHFFIDAVIRYCELKITELPKQEKTNIWELADNQNSYKKRDLQDKVVAYALKEVIQYLEVRSKTHAQICLVSLSGAKDLLSQWRAYASSGGYSIGFDRNILSELATQQIYELLPCIYEEREVQEKYAIKTIDNAVTSLRKNIYEWLKSVPVITKEGLPATKDVKDRIDVDFSHGLGDLIIRLSSILKDKSFEEEAEWRLVSSPVSDVHLSYRSGGSVIKPYTIFKLAQELPDESPHQKEKGFGPISAIKEVWVGPGSEREKRLSAQALAGLFRKHQIPLDFDEEGKTIKNIKITDTTFSKSM